MSDNWKGIESAVAEGRLRGLRRRLAELDDALQGQQEILRQRPDSFAFKLSCDSLLQIQGRLQREMAELMRYRDHETLTITLHGTEFANHSASLAYLGSFMIRLQKLFSSVAQAISTGPTQRGPIATAIRNATDLRLSGIFASSFGMEMRVASDFDMLGHSLSSDALEAVFQLLKSAEVEEDLTRVSGELGRRTTSHFAQLAVALRRAEVELSLRWSDYSGTRYDWRSTPSAKDRIISCYAKTTVTRSETKIYEGLLVGASLLKNRFELLLPTGDAIEGKFLPNLAPVIAQSFGLDCLATVDETEQLDEASGLSRTYFYLRALTPTATVQLNSRDAGQLD